MLLNNELEYYKFEHQKFEDDAKHDDYIRRFIIKQLEKGKK